MTLTHKRSRRCSRKARARPYTLRRAGALAVLCMLFALSSGEALGATSTTPTLTVPASAAPQTSATSATPAPTAQGAPSGTAAGTQAGTPSPTGVVHGKQVVHSGATSKISSAAIALAALAAVIALACAVWALARITAFEPRWVRSARHALAEGGFRASATWAEFSDWLRLGR